MRLTRQSKVRAVSSTKAGVTDAPPLETSRTDDTSTPAPVAPWRRAMAMKKVGGPARNEMRSRGHEVERLLGVEAPDQHGAHARPRPGRARR